VLNFFDRLFDLIQRYGVVVRAKSVEKKSDAPVGRVNTFIILHIKYFKIAFKIWRPLNLQISKVEFSHSESEFVWEVFLGLKILEF
jgi:hypothetical protein